MVIREWKEGNGKRGAGRGEWEEGREMRGEHFFVPLNFAPLPPLGHCPTGGLPVCGRGEGKRNPHPFPIGPLSCPLAGVTLRGGKWGGTRGEWEDGNGKRGVGRGKGEEGSGERLDASRIFFFFFLFDKSNS